MTCCATRSGALAHYMAVVDSTGDLRCQTHKMCWSVLWNGKLSITAYTLHSPNVFLVKRHWFRGDSNGGEDWQYLYIYIVSYYRISFKPEYAVHYRHTCT